MPVYDASLFNPPGPLARVTLRNQADNTGLKDVPMLLDSGADITLVPLRIVNRLGLHINPSEGYELMGFDGSISTAHVTHPSPEPMFL